MYYVYYVLYYFIIIIMKSVLRNITLGTNSDQCQDIRMSEIRHYLYFPHKVFFGLQVSVIL